MIITGDNEKFHTVHETAYVENTFQITVARNYAIAFAITTLSGWRIRISRHLFSQ